jgi:hypothetical protein
MVRLTPRLGVDLQTYKQQIIAHYLMNMGLGAALFTTGY